MLTSLYLDSPAILNKIKDDEFKKFAKALNELWKVLGRKVSSKYMSRMNCYLY